MSTQESSQPTANSVLGKAVLNAGQQLGLGPAELAVVLGVPETVVSRLSQNPDLNSESKEGELALLLVRLARALFAFTGGIRSGSSIS